MRHSIICSFAILFMFATVRVAEADNAARYTVIQSSLADTAPIDNPIAVNFAGVVFGTALPLSRWDTPDNKSFYPVAQAKLIWGPSANGLGQGAWGAMPVNTPCTVAGVTWGTVRDIRWFMMRNGHNPAQPYMACATNTHIMYNAMLERIVTCGEKCFVDVGSLSDIKELRTALVEAVRLWLNGKPHAARLSLRITIGYFVLDGIGQEVAAFHPVVEAGRGRVAVYGISFHSGASLSGLWSHVKIFAVHKLGDAPTHVTLIGGQNHWEIYDGERPPFDTNTLVEGAAGALPSLQLDAAIRRFQQYLNGRVLGDSWIGERSIWSGGKLLGRQAFTLARSPDALFGAASGLTSTNPRSTAALGNRNAFVSLIDLGDYSETHVGRTIARALAALIETEPTTSEIRVWQQSFVGESVAQNHSPRHSATPMGELVKRALRAARNGDPNTVFILTSHSNIENDGYRSIAGKDGWNNLYQTATFIACAGDGGFAFGWSDLRKFSNPKGLDTTCLQSVVAAINGKLKWRMARAVLNRGNKPASLGRVGEHHKLVMFGREAMFQGSFNLYSSANPSSAQSRPGDLPPGDRYDSKLVENGAIILQPSLVTDYVDAFDAAWSQAEEVTGQR